MSIYNSKWEKPVGQLSDFHDLHKADGKFVLKRTAIAYVVYPIQTRVILSRDHFIKRNHPLSKHAFIEIVKNIGGLKNA